MTSVGFILANVICYLNINENKCKILFKYLFQYYNYDILINGKNA